jgi:YbgC/YbaW family acyl-CoA thioester hydrolase
MTRRVEFSDTDMAGIMHFSNFFLFMEAAETAFLRSLGFSIALARGGLDLCLPRVHAECDYLAPLRFEDEVTIHLVVEKKGARSLTYRFHFYRQEETTRVEAARGRITLAYVLRQPDGAFKPAPLPGALADLIQQAPAHSHSNGD